MALLLPGMSLNETIFPALGVPVIAADFNRFDGRDLEAPHGVGWGPVMQSYVDAVEQLTRTPRWTRAEHRLVVGHSFGGMLALAWLAARGPGDVHGLLLIGTAAGPMYDVARLRLARLGRVELRVPVAPLMRAWDSRFVTGAVKAVVGESHTAGTRDFQRDRGRSDLAIGLAGWRITTAAAKHSYRAAMRGFDVRRLLPRLDVPAIVLHGTRDTFFPIGTARALAEGLPRGTLRAVPGGRHVLPLSHPDAVRAAAHDLLRDAADEP